MILNQRSDCLFEINGAVTCFIPDNKNINNYDFLTENGWIGTFPRNTVPIEDKNTFISFGENEELCRSYFSEDRIKLTYEER